MITLPKIENEAKVKESLRFVRFCLKYEINPEKEENSITKIETSYIMLTCGIEYIYFFTKLRNQRQF